jgi:ATP-dependent Clp protease ATP-binding subunit ClpA
MFERFTDYARHVIVLAQEEARGDPLRHNYIGTEHLLLGLLGEPRGVGAQVLVGLGMTLDGTRDDVRARVGMGQAPARPGHIPFTPRSKKVLELSLREALELNVNYIGTEHLLLGLIREADGAGAAVLTASCGSLEAVRAAVLAVLPAVPPEGRRRASTRLAAALATGADELPLRTTPAADSGLDEATRLAGTDPVGSHHLVAAALANPASAAARALSALGLDLDQAQAALRQADVTGSADELPEEAGRRQMLIRVADDRLTIELTDPAIIFAGRAALDALGDRAGEPPAIRGELPASASLAAAWLALRNSLEAIRQRALAPPAAGPPAGQATAPQPSADPPPAAAASGS